MLIKRREGNGVKPPWNFNGFGMNDPGKERDTTNFDAEHFDIAYPASLDYKIQDLVGGTYQISGLLPEIKRALPYAFRFENRWARHPDYITSEVTIPCDAPTAAQVFEALANGLPVGWQITVLPGYVIMYKNVRSYPSARRTFTS
jgi:hypothetical protein